jgi:hypothetical protein
MPCLLGLDNLHTSRSVALLPCLFVFVGSLPTGPRAVLQQVIRCVRGLQFEACVPPVLFASQMTFPRKVSILN